MRTFAELMVQRLSESQHLTTAALGGYAAVGGVLAALHSRKRAWRVLAQVHRTTRNAALRQMVEPYLLRNLHMVREDHSSPVTLLDDVGLRIIALKPRLSDQERGVVIVKFSETIRDVARAVDVGALLRDYHLVLEPSWSGYCDPDLLCYSGFNHPVFVMAAEANDHRLLAAMDSNMVPLDMGPSDWVDPDIGSRHLGAPKKYDIVFNANWKQLKRHYVLFSTLKRMRPSLRVALIGGSVGGRTSDDIRRIATHFGVLEQLTFFERIAFDEVMRVNAESRIALLLSLKEGSNRAIAEAMFCNVPGIVLRNHVGGIRKNIVEATGRLIDERDLPEGIESMLANLGSYSPRKWALAHISCYATTARLNAEIKRHALARGEVWTQDIAVKANSPEMRLVRERDRKMLAAEHAMILRYLRN